MKLHIHKIGVLTAVTFAFVALTVFPGCKPDPKPPATDAFNLEVVFQPSDVIKVDLIGVNNDRDLKQLRSVPVIEYFDKGTLRERFRGYTRTFQPSGGATNVISRKDAIWKNEWRGAHHLVVMALMTAEQDELRRVVMCLDRKAYTLDKKTLRIIVEKGMVRPPAKTPCPLCAS